ncbi:MAG: GGDEF domain-containing protein [Sulfurimonas sp.]|nr:GGDEF domain-containing protein [Sulfurimonas sp.]
MSFIKKYTIPMMLASLVIGISYLSYYSYKTQKNLLLTQMHINSLNVANSVSSAIERFNDIKSTMNLQKLVNDISFGLEIFEFRYLEPDGTIRNSMFKEEIGTVLSSKTFVETMKGDRKLDTFFFEVRDFVKVMSIYYPIYKDNTLVGIIDLSVDISEYNLKKGSKESSSLFHRQVDIRNLLKSINGSILNSLAILTKTDINDFLSSYVHSTDSIKQISIIDDKLKVYISSDKQLIEKNLDDNNPPKLGLTTFNNKLTYLAMVNSKIQQKDTDVKLMLLIDASAYANQEKKLRTTAIFTSILALFFALYTSRVIYYSAIEQSREEKERLECLVKERTKEIELLSQTDMLTGLWNRRHLEETLDSEFKRANRYNHQMSIMMIDLDHFKLVNDTYGHMAGDEVLREISGRIKSCQRETDFIGRYGGEEIVVILPETDLDTSIQVADTILKTIAAKPVEFESTSINITTSIGISSLRVEHSDYQMVFAEADEALYKAKEDGRNRVEIFKA